MAEERDDPVPTDDPRQTETSDQNAEDSHPGTSPAAGRAGDGGPSPDAPDTSHEQEGDPDRRPGTPERRAEKRGRRSSPYAQQTMRTDRTHPLGWG